ncbi:hypothetical protein ACWDR1_29055 [Streptosporangium sandarakinum]|uniref:hypothetical protein n=1 Tax=Streptosporangium sandarakinum TaxID=1260955 RepID=UPI0033B0C420
MTSITGEGVSPRQAVAERITTALIPKSSEALQRSLDRTGLSKTDIVNRAIALYDYITDQLDSGKELLLRDSESGEVQVIRLL